jgi:hypothetical protein
MLKRIVITSLLLLILCLSLTPAAFADVIINPVNDFFEEHYEECQFLGRYFYVNSKDGGVSVRQAPDSDRVFTWLANGTVALIQYTYGEGSEAWGAMIFGDWDGGDGWIPMEELALKYDQRSFVEEHEAEIYDYSGDSYSELGDGDVVFYTWPGSGEVAMTLEAEMRGGESDSSMLRADKAYIDGEGREWLQFPYVYASRNNWVCLAEPGNASIPAFNAGPEPSLYPASAAPAGDAISPLTLSIVLVAVVVVVTAVLIKIFWKPAKREQ